MSNEYRQWLNTLSPQHQFQNRYSTSSQTSFSFTPPLTTRTTLNLGGEHGLNFTQRSPATESIEEIHNSRIQFLYKKMDSLQEKNSKLVIALKEKSTQYAQLNSKFESYKEKAIAKLQKMKKENEQLNEELKKLVLLLLQSFLYSIVEE